jgi:hypothetical protein
MAERERQEASVKEPRDPSLRITPPVALSLQQTAGNAAVARLLARDAEPAAAGDADRAHLNGIEQKLAAVAQRAQARSERINAASDGCTQSLRQSKDHLKDQNAAYKTAFTQFTSVLTRADATHESNKAIEDSVQGLLVAAAIGFLAPEAAVLKGAEKLAETMWSTSNATISRVGLKGAVAIVDGKAAVAKVVEAAPRKAAGLGAFGGEGMEQVGGAGVDLAKDAIDKGVGAKPSETATSVDRDKFSEAFGELEKMIDALPQFGKAASSQVSLAMTAQELGKEALRLAGGGQARLTLTEIEDKAVVLQVDDIMDKAEQAAVAAQQGIDRMALNIMSKPVLGHREIEIKLWRAWMAGLQDPRVLENKDIAAHLGPKGFALFDPDEFAWPWESRTRKAVTHAQKDWAAENLHGPATAPAAGASTATAAPPGAPPPK